MKEKRKTSIIMQEIKRRFTRGRQRFYRGLLPPPKTTADVIQATEKWQPGIPKRKK